MDAYAFEKQDFLPVTAAGNDGNMLHEQHSTVSTPATAKNSICVGSTLGEQGRQPQIEGGKAELFRAQYALPGEDSRLRVLDFVGLQAEFGVPLRPRKRPAVPDGGRGEDGEDEEGGPPAQWKIAVAQPLDACYPLANSAGGQLRDRVLLVQRGVDVDGTLLHTPVELVVQVVQPILRDGRVRLATTALADLALVGF